MDATSMPVDRGQTAFNPWTLKLYDWLLELACEQFWRCSIEQTLDLYGHNLSANHLEVGVGTGYFLDRSPFPVPQPRLALLDLNPHCLHHTATRLARYRPVIYRASALDPIEMPGDSFDSIGINYVLHCMPGSFPEKARAFANLKSLLRPAGVLFGSTVLRREVPCDWRARAAMRLLNARNVFCNLDDGLHGLTQALQRNFRDVRVQVIGCVAQFSCRA